MGVSFESVIYDALKAVSYKGTEDNQRLKSALQDLAVDYPREKRILSQNADDRFLEICSRAMEADPEQIGQITDQASRHMQDEYMTAGSWSDKMAAAFAGAFARYGGKKSPSAGETPSERGARIAGGMDEPTVIMPEAETEPEPTRVLSESDSGESKSKGKASSQVTTLARLGVALIAFSLIAIIAIAAIALGLPTDTDSYSELYPELMDESIEIGAGGERTLKVSNLDEDAVIEWTSSDPSVVEVDDNGKIKAIEEGFANVSLTVDEEEIGECSVSVNELTIEEEDGDGEDMYYPTEWEDYTLIVSGTDTESIRWESGNTDVFEFTSPEGKKGEGTAKEPGTSTVTAKVDGQTLTRRIGVWASEGEGLKVNKSEVTVNDESEIIVTYWAENEDEHIFAEWDDGSILDIEWGELYADSQVVKIKKLARGTTTMTIYVVDKDEKRIETIDPVKVKVICE